MMAVKLIFFIVVFTAFVSASPASKSTFWKGTSLDKAVDEVRALCAKDDAISCLKYKFMTFLEEFFKKDTYSITENVDITRNDFQPNEVSSRNIPDLEDGVQEYIQSHDVAFKLPFLDYSVTVDSRSLDNDELGLKLRFPESGNEIQARKSKLKKIIVPIFIFILLKAITLIPLALGVLGLKAWNALQLSFFSFVVSIALAVFQLCKKIAADGHHHHPISAHGPWDATYARSFDLAEKTVNDEEAQKLAYSAYA